MIVNHQEAIYYLESPKLVQYNNDSSIKLEGSIKNVNNSVFDVSIEKNNIVSSNKFDKKNKNYTNNEDLVDLKDSKKNKSKINKRERKNFNINQKDLLHDESINDDIVRVHKFSKKKNKNKQVIINEINFDKNTNLNKNDLNQKSISINNSLTIQELSDKLNFSEAEIITYLFLKGISVTRNQSIDVLTAKDIALHYKFNVLEEDNSIIESSNLNKFHLDQSNTNSSFVQRSPIIAVFGHVDHGKTTLLDSILNTKLVRKEVGGITQAISAYEMQWSYDSNSNKLVFLDTPGHEAFTDMRIRGAKVADIALLIIAADDGLKPQTIESIKLIQKYNLPCIVVINKIDKTNVNILKLKEVLSEYDILDREWGGQSIIIEVSALLGRNINQLLDNICILSQLQKLSADISSLAQGTILESYLDKQKGVVANILIQNGQLKLGDTIIVDKVIGRIKNIINPQNISINSSGPSSIVQVLAFSVMPKAGEIFYCVNKEKEIKNHLSSIENNKSSLNNDLRLINNKISGDYKRANNQLKLIIKTDTQGSLEAIVHAFSKIPQTKVSIHLIAANIGDISRNDVELALASESILVGFHVDLINDVKNLIKMYNIHVKTFSIIYDLIDYIENCMLDLIDFEYEPDIIGKATVQTVFSINKGVVAGCYVNIGKLQKMSNINVYRNNELLYTGVLNSLKRIKNDVNEVLADNECGVLCNDYNAWKPLDVIEAYQLQKKEKKL
uniref:Translation initiation factor IF-2, chloroplastic n=1 Tax=Wrangelia sp. TaxID=2575620 RepID=A0A4D6X215_9FLOR|nr:Translation initiation factor 2 [Wrangelia sp.]